MRKRSSTPREDENQIAARVIDALDPTLEKQPKYRLVKKNEAAVLLGRLGGLRGGKARAEKLSPERRREIARTAAKARWKPAEE